MADQVLQCKSLLEARYGKPFVYKIIKVRGGCTSLDCCNDELKLVVSFVKGNRINFNVNRILRDRGYSVIWVSKSNDAVESFLKTRLDGLDQNPRNIVNTLYCNYYINGDKFIRRCKSFCLVYYNVPVSIDKPSQLLLTINHVRMPEYVQIAIERVSISHYNLFAVINYKKLISVIRSSYFIIKDIIPAVVIYNDTLEWFSSVSSLAVERSILHDNPLIEMEGIAEGPIIRLKRPYRSEKTSVNPVDQALSPVVTIEDLGSVDEWIIDETNSAEFNSPAELVDSRESSSNGLTIPTYVITTAFPSNISHKAGINVKSRENRSTNRHINFKTAILSAYDESKHTLIIGPEGVGKTSVSKFLLDYHCLVAESFSDLTMFNNTYSGIIFENLTLQEWRSRDILALLTKEDRYLVINGIKILIAAKTQIIFTLNKGELINQEMMNSVANLISVIKINSPIYIKQDASRNIIEL